LSYHFEDTDPCNGTVYYRLKQVDLDGTSSYSNVVAVNCKSGFESVELFPNPANTELTVLFNESEDGMMVIRFTDLLGHIALEKSIHALKGVNSVLMNVIDMPAGVYQVEIKKNADTEINPARATIFMKY